MIKITGGEKKGHFIVSPDDQNLRPTSGKVREALFSILGDKVIGAKFLDLFAGSGSIGLEALSRGAAHCTFIENNKIHFQLLQKNIERLNYQNSSTLYCVNSMKFKPKPPGYDIAYIDPPYSSKVLEKILPDIGGSAMIQPNGILIIEHFKKRPLDSIYGFFSLIKSYSYGDTFLSLYRYRNE